MRNDQSEPSQTMITTTGHRIRLIAEMVDKRVTVTGAGSTDLPRNSGGHRFDFEIDDRTGLGVRFKRLEEGMLDVKDGQAECPPPSGMTTRQIHAVTRTSDLRAGFANRNDNREDPLLIAYQLNFECNDAGQHPIQYDPIIKNGGTN